MPVNSPVLGINPPSRGTILPWQVSSCIGYIEYIPVILLAMLFVADSDLDNHAIRLSWQLLITVTMVILFFVLIWQGICTKTVAILVVSIIWIILVYMKRTWCMPVKL
jgi:hypothetical protein